MRRGGSSSLRLACSSTVEDCTLSVDKIAASVWHECALWALSSKWLVQALYCTAILTNISLPSICFLGGAEGSGIQVRISNSRVATGTIYKLRPGIAEACMSVAENSSYKYILFIYIHSLWKAIPLSDHLVKDAALNIQLAARLSRQLIGEKTPDLGRSSLDQSDDGVCAEGKGFLCWMCLL